MLPEGAPPALIEPMKNDTLSDPLDHQDSAASQICCLPRERASIAALARAEPEGETEG
jgi:hypothetical protein